MKKDLILIGIIITLLVGCIETEPVSSVPEITFKSFELFVAYDTFQEKDMLFGKLKFDFVDGDANIGIYYLEDSNSWNENNYNVFLKPYEKINFQYIKVPDDTTKPPLYYNISHNDKLDRAGQNKTIKGTITINIEYLLIPSYDTIRYEFYIRDRHKNNSNVEVTTDIGFKGVSLSGSY